MPVKTRELKKLTVLGVNAASGTATVAHNKNKVQKADINLMFTGSSPVVFTMTPETVDLPAEGSEGRFTLSVEAGGGYVAWSKVVTVKRGKDFSNTEINPTMDDVVETLRGRLDWADTIVDSHLSLPRQLSGSVQIEWKSKTPDYCNEYGRIKQDLRNVTATLEATIIYNGETRVEEFSTTIARIADTNISDANNPSIYYNCFDPDFLVCSYYSDQNKFLIRDINTVSKTITLQLVQTDVLGSLGEIEDSTEYQSMLIDITNRFGEPYRELMRATTVASDKVISYLRRFGIYGGGYATDTDIFTTTKGMFGYEGDLDAFTALDATKRSELVKKGLASLKKLYCEKLGVAQNTEDDKLELALRKAQKAYIALSVYKRKVERTFEYELVGDRLKIKNEYDSVAGWDGQKACSYRGYRRESNVNLWVTPNFTMGNTFVNVSASKDEWSPRTQNFSNVQVQSDGTFVCYIGNLPHRAVMCSMTPNGSEMTVKIHSAPSDVEEIKGTYTLRFDPKSLATL